MKRLIGTLLLGAFLGLQGCELGSTPGGGTGAEGVIVDPSGSPVSGARVWLHSAETGALAKSQGTAAKKVVIESTITDAAGRYRFRGLPQGLYNLQAVARARDTAFALLTRGVALAKADVDLGADTLAYAGTVRILVRDARGAPVQGAKCRLQGTAWSARGDAAGACLIEDVAPGDHVLEVTGNGSRVTGAVTVSDGFERNVTVYIVADPSAPARVEGWRVYELEGYRFYGPGDLQSSARIQGAGYWNQSYGNAELHVILMVGENGPEPDPGFEEYRAREIPWSDSLKANLITYKVGTTWFAVLQIHAWRDGAWELQKVRWGVGTESAAARDDAERILEHLRPVALWRGPGPEEEADLVLEERMNPALSNRFVAVGAEDKASVWTSFDGETWTKQTTRVASGSSFRTVATNGSRIVAVGSVIASTP